MLIHHTDTYMLVTASIYSLSMMSSCLQPFPQCLHPCHGEQPLSPTQMRIISEHLLEHADFLLCDEDSMGELR